MANWSMIFDVKTGRMRPIEVLQEPGWIDGQVNRIVEAVITPMPTDLAMAAPELYAALWNALSKLEEFQSDESARYDPRSMFRTIAECRAALAKARGE